MNSASNANDFTETIFVEFYLEALCKRLSLFAERMLHNAIVSTVVLLLFFQAVQTVTVSVVIRMQEEII
ncbi:hypothetical protein [Alkalicoccus daliensis]|uniref:hypothetical protein n=1 Tax=Alkalicoccus daliensis TaxID=745820 RepID=UPI000B823FEB|nr:hypothetical protein [Alkalicoccus daliensis]